MGLLPDLDLDLDLGPGRNPILGRGIGLIMAGLILGLSFRSGLSLGSHLLGYMSLNLRCLSVVWSSPSRSMSWTRSRIWSGAGSFPRLKYLPYHAVVLRLTGTYLS